MKNISTIKKTISGNYLSALLVAFLLLFFCSQTLSIAHLNSHSYKDNFKKHQSLLTNLLTNGTGQLNAQLNPEISKNFSDFNNCQLCNFANLQKNFNGFAIIILTIILINFIVINKIKSINIVYQLTTIKSRAPPYFA